jgi:hypothetical protein
MTLNQRNPEAQFGGEFRRRKTGRARTDDRKVIRARRLRVLPIDRTHPL